MTHARATTDTAAANTDTTDDAAAQPATGRRLPPLPSTAAQAENLIALGVPELLRLDAEQVRGLAADALPEAETGPPLLVLPGAPVPKLAALMRRGTKPGFVVQDMTDVDDFTPTGVEVPETPYLLTDPDRGDHLRNASPAEAHESFTAEGRTALTVTEGIFWVLAQTEALEPNHCFMTIASRLRKPNGRFDARTPALWISGGTGRDGAERKNAPKVGWCWWRNRHTWLGIASAAHRVPLNRSRTSECHDVTSARTAVRMG
ncbi:DUF5701 family protein [Pseudactinotalea sp. Z1739]|uniref:DUF5701 family protein n=1 Tax=Pseudactinotalea sp. Z1739 TaxID=3413028 RepID=UPI003C7E9AAE